MAEGSRERYTHGHHPSVVAQHARRRAEVEAWFLLPHLRAGQRLLDVGCGPGTVTSGLARAVAPGLTTGLDAAADVLVTAREHAVELGSDNLEFVEGDVYALDYADASFDVVYANQLLQHLADPVAALQEMRRVLRPGGLLGVRDADYATMHPAPKFAEYERWDALYHAVAYVNNAEPDAGRYLSGWVRAAGFDEVELQPNVQLLEGDEARIWGEAWSQRILHSAVASQALEYGLATQAELDELSAGWLRWSQQPRPLFMFIQIAALARR